MNPTQESLAQESFTEVKRCACEMTVRIKTKNVKRIYSLQASMLKYTFFNKVQASYRGCKEARGLEETPDWI